MKLSGELTHLVRKLGEMYSISDLDAFVEDMVKTVNSSHEIRTLRWKSKDLARQCGKQGHRIFELRAAYAEARKLVSVDANYHRRLEDDVREKINANRALLDRINDQNEEIRALQNKLNDAEKSIRAFVGEDLSESSKLVSACGVYRGLE